MTSHSPELDQLATALALAQGSMQGAVKDRTNPAFKSSYADLPGQLRTAHLHPFPLFTDRPAEGGVHHAAPISTLALPATCL